MFNPSLPLKSRGQSSRDGQGRLRRFRRMAQRIRRIGRRNPERAAQLAKRFRAQLDRARDGSPGMMPRDVTRAGKRRKKNDSGFRLSDATTTIRYPTPGTRGATARFESF